MKKKRQATFSILVTLLGCCSATINLDPPEPLSLPQLDFDKLGDVVLAGNFAGISALTYQGQQAMLERPRAEADELITQYSASNVFTKQNFANGRVRASCFLNDTNAIVIAAGNFTSVWNQSVESGLAAIDLDKGTVTPLLNTASTGTSNIREPRFNGSQVSTLWCNGTKVYFGGCFSFDQTESSSSSSSSGVAVWESRNDSWSLPAFGGFTANSCIRSIVEYDGHLVFGGNFTGLAPDAINNTAGTNKSDLLKPGMQPVSFARANVTGYATSANDAKPVDASSVLCPFSDGEWHSGFTSTTGYLNVTLAYMSQPSTVRLFNLADGSGTKTFRIISEPAGSFMNLTFTDEHGKTQSCAAECPLPEFNNSIRHTDFKFVNVVPTTSLKIELLDFYGDHAGLKGLQLFEYGQYAFANNAFNNPRKCSNSASDDNDSSTSGDGEIYPTRSATAQLVGGSWTTETDFMAINITDKSKFASTYAQFNPTFKSYAVDEGHYEVLLYTPGCKRFGTCSQRGQVNVTVYPGFGASNISTILYQTNEEFKYDQIYNGTLAEGAYVKITPTEANQVPLNLVAYKLNLNYLGRPTRYNASKLFEYSEFNFTSSSPVVGDTPINLFGKSLDSSADIGALFLNDSRVHSSQASNLLVGLNTGLVSLPLNGSNQNASSFSGVESDDAIKSLVAVNSTIFALGSSDAYIVVDNSSVMPMHLGSAQDAVVPLEVNNTHCAVFSPSYSNNLSIWDLHEKQILSDTGLSGHITDAWGYRNVTLLVGSIQFAKTTASGLAVLSEDAQQPLKLQKSPSSLAVRREIGHGSSRAGGINGTIKGGLYLDPTEILLYGHFNASLTDNQTVSNALIVNGENTSRSLGEDSSSSSNGVALDPDSSINTGILVDNDVILGGRLRGHVNGTSVQGIFSPTDNYRFRALENGDESSIVVNSIVQRPSSKSIVVGGDFRVSAQNGTCNGICLFELDHAQWSQPANLELRTGSVVNDLVFATKDQMIIAGDLRTSSRRAQVARYNFSSNELDFLPELSAAVKNLVIVSNSSTSPVYVASGKRQDSTYFLQMYNANSSSWQDIPEAPLNSSSTVAAISLVPLLRSNEHVSKHKREAVLFSSHQALLVSGSFNLDQGPASVVIYDGEKWTPLYGTTGIDDNKGEVQSVFSQYGGRLDGGVASANSLGHSHPHPGPNGKNKNKYMSTGNVVGIACAIGLCCVLALMLLYILAEFILLSLNRSSYQNLAQNKPETDAMTGTKIIK